MANFATKFYYQFLRKPCEDLEKWKKFGTFAEKY